MTALNAARNTKVMGADPVPTFLSIPVATGTTIHQGGIVCRNAAGYAVPASAATTLKAVGVAQESVTNAGANGAKSVSVRCGVHKFANSADADALAIADVGAAAWLVDDQTVAKTNGSSTRSMAGTVIQVDADGVWVFFGVVQVQGSAAGGDLAGTYPSPTIGAGKVTPAKIAVKDAQGVADLLVLHKTIEAGVAGAADDVAIFTADAPFKMRIIDAYIIVTAGNSAGRTVTLRTATGGSGTALSDAIACTNAGANRNGATTPATGTVAASGTLVLRRSHDAVAGELVVHMIRES